MSKYGKINTKTPNWCHVAFMERSINPSIMRIYSSMKERDIYRDNRDFYNDIFTVEESFIEYGEAASTQSVMCVEDMDDGTFALHYLNGRSTLNHKRGSFRFAPRTRGRFLERDEINYPIERSLEDIEDFGYSIYYNPENRDLPL